MNRARFRRAGVALLGVAALTLSACNGTDTTTTTPDDPATISPTDPVIPEDGTGQDVPGQDAPAQGAPAAAAPEPGPRPAEGPPCEVTGYTAYAEQELLEENVSRDEVSEVISQGCAGGAQVDWEDDGYWEIEFRDIDVDIYPNGVVSEVDR